MGGRPIEGEWEGVRGCGTGEGAGGMEGRMQVWGEAHSKEPLGGRRGYIPYMGGRLSVGGRVRSRGMGARPIERGWTELVFVRGAT